MKKKTFLPRLLTLMVALQLFSGCADNAVPSGDTGTSTTGTGTSAISTTSSADVSMPTGDSSQTIPDTTDSGSKPGTITPSQSQSRPWVAQSGGSTTTTKSTTTTTKGTTAANQSKPDYNKSDLYNLVQYLTFQTDNYAIGLHFYGSPDVNKLIQDFKQRTGKEPAYIDFDMNSLPFYSARVIDSAVSQITEFAKKGGFVAISDHWITPTNHYTSVGREGANNSRGVLTREQYYEVMTDGTRLNRNFIDELEIKAKFLKKLRDNGVPVIFRPLHEANGNWFWWGIHPNEGITGADVIALYKYVHKYFTVTQGLNNVIWEFCGSMDGNSSTLCTWYPGDQYVDMLSLDWYLPSHDYKVSYDQVTKECGTKPFAISEYGGHGGYDATSIALADTLSILEATLDRGAKLGYVGLYFVLNSNQNCTLSSRAITLDQLSGYWTKSRR